MREIKNPVMKINRNKLIWVKYFRMKLWYTLQQFRFNPVNTGCKLNLHKRFRRRQGRLLNVLCAFNLRPVTARKQANWYISWNKNKNCAPNQPWSSLLRKKEKLPFEYTIVRLLSNLSTYTNIASWITFSLGFFY